MELWLLLVVQNYLGPNQWFSCKGLYIVEQPAGRQVAHTDPSSGLSSFSLTG